VVLSGIDEAGDLRKCAGSISTSSCTTRSQLDLLAADRDPRPLRLWLKLDTGMHRLGFDPARTDALLARLRALPNVHADIVLMSHFAVPTNRKTPRRAIQIARFAAATSAPRRIRSPTPPPSCIWPKHASDWVRAGGALYGLSVEHGRSGADDGFRPAMSLSSKLIAINRVAKGERIGYGGLYECPEDMDIGVVADRLRRRLSAQRADRHARAV
jgi:alanine racemase